MIRSKIPLYFFFLCAGLIVCFSCAEETSSVREQNTTQPVQYIVDADLAEIMNGDIIVKRGNGRVSQMIAETMNEKVPVSHCGIIIRINDSAYIIHSVAKELSGKDGVQRVDFRTFRKDCVKGLFYVVRYKGDETTRNRIALTAQNHVRLSTPFDYELNHNDSSRINCSELVYRAVLNASGKDIFRKVPVKDKIALAFNSLLDTANFRIIYHY